MFAASSAGVSAYGIAALPDAASPQQASPSGCCHNLHLVTTPARGLFGHPKVNILGEYTFNGAIAHHNCSGCKEPTTLRQALEAFMGGRRWTFVTKGRQYAAFGSHAATCPEHVDAWKYWRTNQYVEGHFLLRCGGANR